MKQKFISEEVRLAYEEATGVRQPKTLEPVNKLYKQRRETAVPGKQQYKRDTLPPGVKDAVDAVIKRAYENIKLDRELNYGCDPYKFCKAFSIEPCSKRDEVAFPNFTSFTES